jgi:hypothetical protein
MTLVLLKIEKFKALRPTGWRGDRLLNKAAFFEKLKF